MKIKYLLLFIFFAVQGSHAQTVVFKEIKLKPRPEFNNRDTPTIIYPLIITSNKAVDRLINENIKNEMFSSDNEKLNIRQTLDTAINENGLTALYYEVTYKKNGILSFFITSEGCGAYCSTSFTYFNFDLKTGKNLSISDLISENKIAGFRKIVFADKLKALNKYKAEEANNGEDSAIIAWALEEVNDCIDSAEIEKFSVSASHIEIIDRCEFPHAIQSQQPDYELKYSYKFMMPFLKPKYKSLFLK